MCPDWDLRSPPAAVPVDFNPSTVPVPDPSSVAIGRDMRDAVQGTIEQIQLVAAGQSLEDLHRLAVDLIKSPFTTPETRRLLEQHVFLLEENMRLLHETAEMALFGERLDPNRPLTADQLTQLQDTLRSMDPAALRALFEKLAQHPNIPPELQATLQELLLRGDTEQLIQQFGEALARDALLRPDRLAEFAQALLTADNLPQAVRERIGQALGAVHEATKALREQITLEVEALLLQLLSEYQSIAPAQFVDQLMQMERSALLVGQGGDLWDERKRHDTVDRLRTEVQLIAEALEALGRARAEERRQVDADLEARRAQEAELLKSVVRSIVALYPELMNEPSIAALLQTQFVDSAYSRIPEAEAVEAQARGERDRRSAA